MKKIISISLLTFIIFFFSIIVIGILFKVKDRTITRERISELPEFQFNTLSNTLFSSEEIKEGPLLLVYFHPECEHCQIEVPEFLKSDIPLSFCKVLLVSNADPDSIHKFLSFCDMSKFQSVKVLLDSSDQFQKTFGKSYIPSTFIYDKRLHLIKAVYGEIKSDLVLRYLRESEQNK